MTGELEPTNEGYAIAKIAGIKACRSIHEELGYNYISLMPCNLYGPNDNFDLVNSHVPAALMRRIHEAKIYNKKSVEVWGTGKAKREFMHVDDLANAVWYFLGRSDCAGELINIGSGKDMSILRFAELVRLTVGYKGDLKFNADMPEGTPRKVLNVDKARNLGWESRIEIESGIRSFYEWFKNSYGKGEVRGI
jgi:GDP-L-fucose synthase